MRISLLAVVQLNIENMGEFENSKSKDQLILNKFLILYHLNHITTNNDLIWEEILYNKITSYKPIINHQNSTIISRATNLFFQTKIQEI